MSYFPSHVFGGDSPGSFAPGSDSCGGGLVAYDEVDKTCHPVYGLGITIGDTTASNEGGFSVFNLNVHKHGTQIRLVNSYQLEGPVAV